MAGLGAAINTGAVMRGDSVAVIGCGGVGIAAIIGARLAGAAKIIAVDIDDRKLRWARELGATHAVSSTSADAVTSIRELSAGFGADVVIDAVGRPETYAQACTSVDGCRWRRSSARRSGSATSKRLSPRWNAATSRARSWCSDLLPRSSRCDQTQGGDRPCRLRREERTGHNDTSGLNCHTE
jgi:spermidine synthase